MTSSIRRSSPSPAVMELLMTSFGRKSISHLGTLHGKGTLLTEEGRSLGQVIYQIDGYLDGGGKSANGQIEAESRILDDAFNEENATIVLESGRCIHVVVSKPQGGETAEVRVRGTFPL